MWYTHIFICICVYICIYMYIYIYIYISSISRAAPEPQKSVGGRVWYLNTLGGAPLTLIFEQSQIGGARHPPPPRAKVTISYKHAHIDTQAQTCTQTNTDVLRSSWYFLGFLGGLIFHARPLLIFPRRVFKYCVGGMVVHWHWHFTP